MRVLVLSHTTGYQLRAFDDAAAALGVELAFATDRCQRLDDPWQDHAIAVRFYDVDASVRAIVAAADKRGIDGLIAVGDRPVVLAAHAADALHLPWHSVAGALASSDKRKSRAALAAAGLPSPRFEAHRIRDAASGMGYLRFPLVLKPVGLSGSRGVIRANDEREFRAAFDRIAALLARPQLRVARADLEDQIVVEEYIAGREFAVEGVMTRGTLRVFAIFDKPDPLDGPFFEETIYVTPSREPEHVRERIADHVARAARALGLTHGPIHAECRVTTKDDVYVLEVAGRPIGGLCSRVLTFQGAGGLASLEEALLRHAVGESLDGWAREERSAAVMMIPIPRRGMYKGVTGLRRARAIAGITDVRVTAKPGQLLEPLPEAGSYLGFIFSRGSTPAAAEFAVRQAHRELAFEIGRELRVARM
jgi:biotin carboxylase